MYKYIGCINNRSFECETASHFALRDVFVLYREKVFIESSLIKTHSKFRYIMNALKQ